MNQITFLVKVAYDGNYFYGWAKQPKLTTIQGELEAALEVIYQQPINIIGAGRTDRYVHAVGQHFSFSVPVSKNSIQPQHLMLFLEKRLNHIKILEIKEVSAQFHARYASKQKIYHYKLKTNWDLAYEPLLENYFLLYDKSLNLPLIKRAINHLVGEKDFASFSAKENYQTSVRRLDAINLIEDKKENTFTFEFIGAGFLRYMVRNLVGVLLALNENNLQWEEFLDLIDNPAKGKSVFKARGCALYLENVAYS